ncbi:MAG: DNA repair protein RecO [Chlamydiota bacterium]
MKEERIEGITLRSQEYQEKSRIISIYTAPLGLIQMIIKKVSTPRLMSLSTPFTYAEFHYHRGRSNLFRLLEGSPIDEHLYLREKLNSLKAAGHMTAALLHLLLPESSDPPLYALYKTYLKQIPSFEDTAPLLTSFYLKLLSHEALLEWHTFSPTDRPLAEALANARSFDTLRTLSLSPALEIWTTKMSTTFIAKTK